MKRAEMIRLRSIASLALLSALFAALAAQVTIDGIQTALLAPKGRAPKQAAQGRGASDCRRLDSGRGPRGPRGDGAPGATAGGCGASVVAAPAPADGGHRGVDGPGGGDDWRQMHDIRAFATTSGR